MFAVSTMLADMMKQPRTFSRSRLRHIEMAAEILEAMDESVVAKKSAKIVEVYIQEIQRSRNTSPDDAEVSNEHLSSPYSHMATVGYENQEVGQSSISEFRRLTSCFIQVTVSMSEFVDCSIEDMASLLEGLGDNPDMVW